MSTAKPIDIKAEVFNILETALPDFEVTWSFSQRNPPRKWCYLGDMSWPAGQWETNRSRQYTLQMPIVLNVLLARTSPQNAETYLQDQLDSLSTAFDATCSLRNVGVISWLITPRQLGTQPHADGIEGQCVAELTVDYRPEHG